MTKSIHYTKEFYKLDYKMRMHLANANRQAAFAKEELDITEDLADRTRIALRLEYLRGQQEMLITLLATTLGAASND